MLEVVVIRFVKNVIVFKCIDYELNGLKFATSKKISETLAVLEVANNN